MKYLYGAILFLAALFYFFLFAGEREYRRDPSVKAHSYIEGLRIVDRKNGEDSWVIAAERADFSRNETEARMQAVTMRAVKEGMTLDADSGTYNLASRELRLDENVKIRIRDSVISAKNLTWSPSTGVLTSGEKVLMDGKRFRVEGEGFTATRDQKLKLTGNVKATFH